MNSGKNAADALQFLNVTVFDGDKCKSVYEERQGFINPETQLCAGSFTNSNTASVKE